MHVSVVKGKKVCKGHKSRGKEEKLGRHNTLLLLLEPVITSNIFAFNIFSN